MLDVSGKTLPRIRNFLHGRDEGLMPTVVVIKLVTQTHSHKGKINLQRMEFEFWFGDNLFKKVLMKNLN